ncbi:PREDICTED: B-cell receptor CD22 [Elephantulus edwardii]|uniref:B-cell receptor CD22 n=1 Tax=Elephantulus edwardii TaxID=28737 RepID=UPI0003F0CD35|nr:PREDICTED: B-cell receptor CD22 [Elephantulus edwardii]
MSIFSISVLLLGYLAFSVSTKWNIQHPQTLYSWEGACIWIPCLYTIRDGSKSLEILTVYHHYEYNNTTKHFHGTILHQSTTKTSSHVERVQFLGNLQNNCSLRIQPAYVNDSGLLGLRMETSGDRWMEKIKLNISERPFPPHIQLPQEIRESQEVTLTCLLNFTCPGYPVQLQWSLEKPAVNSESLDPKTAFTKSKLTFQPQWSDHGKNVTCQLRDLITQQILSQETVRLDVKHVPKLELEVSPRDAIVTEGESVTMTCHIRSSYPKQKTIMWFKDFKHLENQETDMLILSRVTKNDSGKYRCQVSNDLGQGDSEDVSLQVLFAPEPSRVQISPLPAREGNLVILTCVSSANPPPTNYTWSHNGRTVLGKTEETFQIPKILPSHSGSYSCLAENSIGAGQVGQKAELDVQYLPKGVTLSIKNPTPIREGDDVTLVCNYNSSNPKVSRYEWEPQASKNKSFPEVLTIQKVPWNVRPVSCQACNFQCTKSPSLSLEVHYAPRGVKVKKIRPSAEIRSGEEVLLWCEFSGSHPKDVHYFWKKNGSLLKEGKELKFGSISPEDAGYYSCSVNNSMGQTTSEAWMLQVLYAPRWLRVSIAPNSRVMEGKKVFLTCESDANPPIFQYIWFDQNNQQLQHIGQTLRLESAKVQHSGAYRCRGVNMLGLGDSTPSTLTVYYSPETIGRRAAVGLGACLSIFMLAFWGVKLQKSWKKIQGQQGLQENSSGQSFFVRNKKARRARLSEGPHSLGCSNPAMEDGISYAALRFPLDDTDASSTGDVGTSVSIPNGEDTVTYSVVQKRRVDDYENVAQAIPEDEGLHYSELVHFGAGVRPPTKEEVEYVKLKP